MMMMMMMTTTTTTMTMTMMMMTTMTMMTMKMPRWCRWWWWRWRWWRWRCHDDADDDDDDDNRDWIRIIRDWIRSHFQTLGFLSWKNNLVTFEMLILLKKINLSTWSQFCLLVAALSGPQQFRAFTVKMCLLALFICMSSIFAPRVDLQFLEVFVDFVAINEPIACADECSICGFWRTCGTFKGRTSKKGVYLVGGGPCATTIPKPGTAPCPPTSANRIVWINAFRQT